MTTDRTMSTLSENVAVSLIDNADGSALWTQGTTKVVASVTGPIDVRPRDELPTEATVNVLVRPAAGVSATRERLLESRIADVFQPLIDTERYPRSLIQILVQIVHCDVSENITSVCAAAINCTALALMDSGLPIRSIPVACCLQIVPSIDGVGSPVIKEHSSGKYQETSTHLICYETQDDLPIRLVLSESLGLFTEKELIDCFDAAGNKSSDISRQMRKIMQLSISEKLAWRQSL